MAKTNNNKKSANVSGKDTRPFRNNGGKNYRGNKSERGSSDRGAMEYTENKAYNDVAWYANNPQLLRDTCSLAFPNALGLPQRWLDGHVDEGLMLPLQKNEVTPGIMSLYWIPSVGSNHGTALQATGLNIAARNLYSFIRFHNSGAKNYEAADLMTYVLSTDSIFYLLCHAMRAYGVARTYSTTNRYYSNCVLKSMGFVPDDVYANLAQFRASINLLVYKMKQLAIPAVYSYFKRHAWMSLNLFMDTTNTKAQTYLYVPRGFYRWSGTAYETGSALLYTELDQIESGYTTSEFIDVINDALEVLLTNEDIGIMSGDILKAYGKEKCFTLNEIGEDFSIIPDHNTEVLAQIHNTTLIHAAPVDLDITQVDQYLQSALLFSTDGYFPFADQAVLIDSSSAAPTPEEVMVSTRNITVCDIYDDDVLKVQVKTCGSEIFTHANVFTSPSGDYTSVYSWDVIDGDYYDASRWAALLSKYASLSRFDWAPKAGIIYQLSETDPGKAFYVSPLWETDNMTSISAETLRSMHDIAIMSMLTAKEQTV